MEIKNFSPAWTDENQRDFESLYIKEMQGTITDEEIVELENLRERFRKAFKKDDGEWEKANQLRKRAQETKHRGGRTGRGSKK